MEQGQGAQVLKFFGFDTAWLGLAIKGRKAMAEIDKAEGFSVQLMLWKGLKTFVLALSMQLAPVILSALSDDRLVASSLQSTGAPVAVVTAVTALVVALGKMGANYWTHRAEQ